MADPRALGRRLLANLGVWLLNRALGVSIVSYFLAVASLVLLPALSVKIYVDENALMPGGANPTYSAQHATLATSLATHLAMQERSSMESWLRSQLDSLGLHHHVHEFCHPSPRQRLESLLLTSKAGQKGALQPPGTSHFTAGSSSEMGPSQGHERQQQQQDAVCRGRNIVARVNSQRGRGDESIVLVTPLEGSWNTRDGGKSEPSSPGASDTVGLSFALSLLELLSTSKWLARDVIWLVADSACGADVAVHHWLKEYYQGSPSTCSSISEPGPTRNTTHSQGGREAGPLQGSQAPPAKGGGQGGWGTGPLQGGQAPPAKAGGQFLRGGMLFAAVVFHVERDGWDWGDGSLGQFLVRANGLNGHMPNMDMPALAARLAEWMYLPMKLGVGSEGGQHSKGDQDPSASSTTLQAAMDTASSLLDSVREVATSVGVPVTAVATGAQYRDRAAFFLQQIIWQLQGTSPGAHGPFRAFQVDAMSVTAEANSRRPRSSARSSSGQERRSLQAHELPSMQSLMSFGRLLESIVRCISNLSERLHHSHFFYILCSGDSFLPITHFIAPFALLLLPFAFAVAHASACCNQLLLLPATSSPQGDDSAQRPSACSSSPHSGLLWASSGSLVLSTYFWGCLVAIIPAAMVFAFEILHPLNPTAAAELEQPAVALSLWGLLSVLTLATIVLAWRTLLQRYLLSTAFAFSTTLVFPVSATNPAAAAHTGEESTSRYLTLTQEVTSPVHETKLLATSAVAAGCAGVGLAAACAVNYAVALAGALVLAPLFWLALPWRTEQSSAPRETLVRGALAALILAGLSAASLSSLRGLTAAEIWSWVLWAVVEVNVAYVVSAVIILPSAVCCLFVLLPQTQLL